MTLDERLREILDNNFGCKNAFCPACTVRNIEKCPQIAKALLAIQTELLKVLPEKDIAEKIFREEFVPLYPKDKPLSEMTGYENSVYRQCLRIATLCRDEVEQRIKG